MTLIKMRRIENLVLVIPMLLTSCEGVMDIRGTILSADTHLPIEAAMVRFHEQVGKFGTSEDTVYTDSNGTFEVGSLTMCAPDCPEVKLIVSKIGYVTFVKNYEKGIVHDSLTIELT